MERFLSEAEKELQGGVSPGVGLGIGGELQAHEASFSFLLILPGATFHSHSGLGEASSLNACPTEPEQGK